MQLGGQIEGCTPRQPGFFSFVPSKVTTVPSFVTPYRWMPAERGKGPSSQDDPAGGPHAPIGWCKWSFEKRQENSVCPKGREGGRLALLTPLPALALCRAPAPGMAGQLSKVAKRAKQGGRVLELDGPIYMAAVRARFSCRSRHAGVARNVNEPEHRGFSSATGSERESAAIRMSVLIT